MCESLLLSAVIPDVCVDDSSTTVHAELPWNTGNLLLCVFGQQLEAQSTSGTETQQMEQMLGSLDSRLQQPTTHPNFRIDPSTLTSWKPIMGVRKRGAASSQRHQGQGLRQSTVDSRLRWSSCLSSSGETRLHHPRQSRGVHPVHPAHQFRWAQMGSPLSQDALVSPGSSSQLPPGQDVPVGGAPAASAGLSCPTWQTGCGTLIHEASNCVCVCVAAGGSDAAEGPGEPVEPPPTRWLRPLRSGRSF